MFFAPFLFFLGALCWLVGSALMVASQPRFFISSATAPIPRGVGVFGTGLFDAGVILYIIGSALWVIAAFIHLIGSYAELRTLRQMLGGNVKAVPQPAYYLVRSAWLQFIATIGILVGSAIFIGTGFSDVSTGAILWLIFFGVWAVSAFITTGVALMVLSVTPFMPDMMQRYRSWHGLLNALGLLISMIFFCLGAILWITIRPPGAWLIASLLYLTGSVFLTLTFANHLLTTYAYYVPVSGFLTAATAYGPRGAGAAAAGLAAPSYPTTKGMDVVSGHEGRPALVAPPLAPGPAYGTALPGDGAGGAGGTVPVSAQAINVQEAA